MPLVLALAGLDPSGGAGLVRDLAEIERAGCRAQGVVTALTVQDGRRFVRHQAVDAGLVAEQLGLLAEGPPPDAVCVGMLAGAPLVDAVAAYLARVRPRHVVLDPVLGASAGGALLDEAGLDALRARLLPHVTLLTPNLDEARRLFGLHLDGRDEADALTHLRAARAPLAADLLVKGGHRAGPGRGTDWLVTRQRVTLLPPARRLPGGAHGTGCTLKAALAAALARGDALPVAARYAKSRVEAWIRSAPARAGSRR